MTKWLDMATRFNFLQCMYPDTLPISGCQNDLYHFSQCCQQSLLFNSFMSDTCEANVGVVNSLSLLFSLILIV